LQVCDKAAGGMNGADPRAFAEYRLAGDQMDDDGREP